MFRFEIKGKPITTLEINCRRMTNAAIREIARQLVDLLRINAPEWRGHLKASIKAEPIKRSAVAIAMYFYGLFLEKGHRIPPKAARSPLLRTWAREKLVSPDTWLAIVEKYGWYVMSPRPAFKRPFIEPSIKVISGRIPQIMRQFLRRRR